MEKKMCFNSYRNPSWQTLTLPQHLIVEKILPKLPARSLIRFKAVSNLWLTTISAPEFTKTHLHFSSSCPQFLMLTENSFGMEILSVHYDDIDSEIKDMGKLEFKSSLIKSRYNILRLVGSCNGLLCLACSDIILKIQTFLVWNPGTNQIRGILFPLGERTNSTVLYHVCHFSYVSSRDEYRLFASFWPKRDEFARCYMFSSSTRKWKRFDDKNVFKIKLRSVVLIDDTVYILLSERIIGFSLANEEIIESPSLDWPSTYGESRIVELRGCLSLLWFTDGNVCDVWILKRPCEWDSLEKVYSVNFSSFDMYGISRNGKCLIYRRGQLKIVDLLRGSGTPSPEGIHSVVKLPVVYGTTEHVDSLVSPF